MVATHVGFNEQRHHSLHLDLQNWCDEVALMDHIQDPRFLSDAINVPAELVM
jgi:hypothetical protein